MKDSLKSARLKASVERDIEMRQYRAMKRVREMQTDDARKWTDRTIADVTNLKIFEALCAEKRAERAAISGPQVFGVVMMQPRIEDHRSWERMGSAIEGKVIDDDHVLTEVVQRGTGPIGEGARQLRENLRQEEKAEAQQETGKDKDQG